MIIQIALGIVLGWALIRGYYRLAGWRSRRSWQKRLINLYPAEPSEGRGRGLAICAASFLMGCAWLIASALLKL